MLGFSLPLQNSIHPGIESKCQHRSWTDRNKAPRMLKSRSGTTSADTSSGRPRLEFPTAPLNPNIFCPIPFHIPQETWHRQRRINCAHNRNGQQLLRIFANLSKGSLKKISLFACVKSQQKGLQECNLQQ